MTPRPIDLDDLGSNLLQVFRLAHAIAEAGVPIRTAPDNQPRWTHLADHHPDVPIRTDGPADRVTATVDHATPVTGVGDCRRPLVFAHAVADRCAELWSERSVAISFAGLITDQRRGALRPLTDQFGDRFEAVATRAGRSWPGKAWDEEYYAVLGRSALVACPDGDYVWTYRFFEAALCGAIPVIEHDCEHYEGFRFHRIGDPADQLVWREDWAAHNHAAARRLLTVPHDELRDAVEAARIGPAPAPPTPAGAAEESRSSARARSATDGPDRGRGDGLLQRLRAMLGRGTD